jgi:hypothetical protein
MRIRRSFIPALIVAFVVLSMLANSRATPRDVTVTVREFRARESMSVSNTYDPISFQIALRETTTYEGSPADIKPGVRVTVPYRNVGERLVADKVRVLLDAATR